MRNSYPETFHARFAQSAATHQSDARVAAGVLGNVRCSPEHWERLTSSAGGSVRCPGIGLGAAFQQLCSARHEEPTAKHEGGLKLSRPRLAVISRAKSASLARRESSFRARLHTSPSCENTPSCASAQSIYGKTVSVGILKVRLGRLTGTAECAERSIDP